MIDMQAKGYATFCSSDNNLVRRAETLEELETKQQHESYAYAAFLMAVEPGGTLRFGIDAYREPSPDNPEPHLWIHPQYFLGIGKPMESVSPDQVESYRISGSETFCREFEHAFVFLNTSDSKSDTINLGMLGKIGGQLNDQGNDKLLEILEIGPHSGMILMK